MAKNQVFQGPLTGRRFAAVPSTVKSGDPLLLGNDMFGVAVDDYSSQSGGTVVDFVGSYNLTVVAKSSLSPSTGAAINPGDKLYADGGTQDGTTKVTTGFTIDVNTGGTFIGWLDPSGGTGAQAIITSSTTSTTAVVKLKGFE